MNKDILGTFEKFTDEYALRDAEKIDEFMGLFSDDSDVQMIGIGATVPGEYEWFTGKEEIIVSDWTYWRNVHFDMDNLRITQKGDTAWFSLCTELEQTEET